MAPRKFGQSVARLDPFIPVCRFEVKGTGRKVHGLRIEYEQTRKGYRRDTARRGEPKYLVAPNRGCDSQRFVQVVEVPMCARNIHFYSDRAELPAKYERIAGSPIRFA